VRERILRKIRLIPKGKVATYGEVARAAGYPGAARQVAWALHAAGGRLPWHRVVGAGGRILLGGHQAMEQRLRLETEGVRFRGDRIDLAGHEHRFGKYTS
jgi:methylated-DNA-protein-cysteine methyltransferase related protein